jgi:hypothetical protein
MYENIKRVLEPCNSQDIRARVEAVANANGYRFDYQVLPVH